MTNNIASNPNITEASVWLYLTEKGRENKKKPFKYWMNNTEVYFELSYVHPTHVFDVQTLLADAYNSFLQSLQVVVYENDKKRDMPYHYPAETTFVNPFIDDVNLITWTAAGWKIPFRCSIRLPIDKVKYIQLYVNGWAVEFTLYAKASSKNKLDAGAPQLFPILGKMQRSMLGQHRSPGPFFTDPTPILAEDPAGGSYSDPFSTSSGGTPNYTTPDSYGEFDPSKMDQVDPSVLDSPDFTYTSNDSFDTIISNYNPDQFEEEKRIAREIVKGGRPSRAEERRKLQGRPSSTDTAVKKEKKTTLARKKKSTDKPKLLLAKKEGDKFTQYIPTREIANVKLDPIQPNPHSGGKAGGSINNSGGMAGGSIDNSWDVPTATPTPVGPTGTSSTFTPDRAIYSGRSVAHGSSMVIHHITLQPDEDPSEEDDSLGDAGSELNNPLSETNQQLAPHRPTDIDEEELDSTKAFEADRKVEAEREVEDSYTSSSSATDQDDEDESEEELSEDESSVDERTKPVVLKRVPVKPVIDQIAERTGIDKEALALVFKTEKSSGKAKENIAFIDELHKDLRINNFPLKYYSHVLAFTEQYSVPSQRNFTFFVDKGNKLRFYKRPSIEIAHQSLNFNLHVKQFGKPLVSHQQVTCVMNVEVALQNETGFIAIVPEHVGLVIIVPFAFNTRLYENFKNPPK